MADPVRSLPTDSSAPTHPELKIVDYLFEKDGSQGKIQGLMSSFKLALFATVLFVIFSLPLLDKLIPKVISAANNYVILMIIKSILFMIIFYIIENFWIVRKK